MPATRRKRSAAWRYFKLVEGKAVCQINQCSTELMWHGSTTALNAHLQSRHSDLMKINLEASLSPNHFQSSSEVSSVTPNVTSTPPISMNFFGPSEGCAPVSNHEIDRKICDWVVAGPRHACAVEEKEFRDLLQLLAPNYQVPSAVAVAEMINSRHFAAKTELQQTLMEASRRGKVALSVCFASDANRVLILRAHFVTDAWAIKSLTIGCLTDLSHQKRSGEDIAKWMNEKLQDFYLIAEAVIAIVHCNDINVQAGVSMLAEACNWHFFLCCRSLLRYLTGNLYRENTISRDLDEIEEIVQFFTSSEAGKMLTKRPKQSQMDIEHTNNKKKTSSTSTSKSKSSNGQENADFKAARSLIKVLHPLDAAMSYLQNSEFVPSSSIPIFLSGLEKKLRYEVDKPLKMIKEENNAVSNNNEALLTSAEIEKQLKQKLLEELQSLTMFTSNDVTTVAAALDPRYKKLSFISAEEKRAVYSMLSTECFFLHKDDSNDVLNPEEPPPKRQVLETVKSSKVSTNALMDDIMKLGAGCQEEEQQETNQEVLLTRIKLEMDRYFAEKPPGSDICPLGWWRANQSKYPMMSKVARSYLCIPAVADYSIAKVDEAFISPICNHVPICKTDKILLPK